MGVKNGGRRRRTRRLALVGSRRVAFERPTFHESWYRVAELHPRIRSTVQITRQHYRGQPWHVVQDHTNNAFFRLSQPAYYFLGLLNGQRTVGEAWHLSNEHLGDDAPTQGEVIQLLGQLYTSNLLQAELPADTHGLFGRYKKRVQREIRSYLMNIMFIRIPLLDPDRFLEKWMPLFGWIFSWIGLAIWTILMSVAFYSLATIPNWTKELFEQSTNVLNPSNIIGLYFCFAVIKGCHEFGHAISCKKFGLTSGVGGEVHVMGIMFLIFSPVPYVDASSSWALRSKWQRITVGAAGMWVEFAIACIAAIIWAATHGQDNLAHQLSYNIMFVASVSTVMFNANPLLRYDGYYMLSDILEIPNMAQRSKEYIYYLVKQYVWKLRQPAPRNPSHSSSEAFWLFNYAWSSFAMRIAVSFGIMIYLATVLDGVLILIAALMGVAAIFTWILMPLGRFVHYLATSQELARIRTRAVLTTLGFVLAVGFALGMIPAPDHVRAQGVVEPQDYLALDLNTAENGFITSVAPTTQLDPTYGVPVVNTNTLIYTADNQQLRSELASIEADKRRLISKRDTARLSDPGAAQMYAKVVETQQEIYDQKQKQIDSLTKVSPLTGLLSAPHLEQAQGMYIKRGEKIGVVASLQLQHLTIRATASNQYGGPLFDDYQNNPEIRQVQIRVAGRPDFLLTGTIVQILPAGQSRLPSASLGYKVGGQMAVANDDQHGTKTTEDFFEVHIQNLKFVTPDDSKQPRLLPGQRVVVRFNLKSKSLASQAWTSLLQMIQKRFSA